MEFTVLKGQNLNTTVYRGFATLRELSQISKADTYNQDRNPEGLQRDLSDRHARDAYRYAEGAAIVGELHRLWPEILLNVRDADTIKFEVLDEKAGVYKMKIMEDKLNLESAEPQISRTDGNHRLAYGGGNEQLQWAALDISTPFSLTVELDPDAEAIVFMDINDNQKTMNTSHLAHLKARLTDTERLQQEDPALWIAEKLCDDPKSSFHGLVHKGGERTQGLKRRINLAALRTGISMVLADSVKLRAFDQIEPKYVLIRAFWNAVQITFSDEWSAPRQSLLLKGFGLWTMSMLGAEVIDRCLSRRIEIDQLPTEMEYYLRQARPVVTWSDSEMTQRFGGRSGAKRVAENMKKALSDEDVDAYRIGDQLSKTL